MDDQMMSEGFWFGQMLQLTTWLEWLQPLLYCLLAIAAVSLVLTLFDLTMLCWKEFHTAAQQETTNARTEMAPLILLHPESKMR